MNEHEFALYYPVLSKKLEEKLLHIAEKELVHRISRILRLNLKDSLIFFDKTKHAQVIITSIDKKEVVVEVTRVFDNESIQPELVIQLGLLKREALENTIEALTVFGVNKIQLFMSEKVSRKWGGQKEFERLERVMIAAAEQSKQFVLPQLEAPILFEKMIKQQHLKRAIFCDPSGNSLIPLICKDLEDLVVLIGPEGDLTLPEKEILCQQGYDAYRLTKSILRSELAATLVAGIIRTA
ncbi:TPA: hypothetical protein DIC20_01345 [Candidatus Dependentiae bacterium]|nr:MAG: RNA methyltransferase [candidate division TM6 bacterium GW2011_GWF2_36_131]KKQ03556.1 MAG: RNA methyltransferase [candidate division TM6 bacterium GW2011_GWE2_36_25]KKQ20169.1 MAG: RNA methyltransferase [candidate division TM6 bacterium GW2011_GWA2_36_9]HBR70710.1 hypothetical protein [Candidatus Dependentiae bacterium]HCU00330.1 hypothetical protein [Candidatus Dependentiae bacterium]